MSFIVIKILALYPPFTAWVVYMVMRFQRYRADRIALNVATFLPEVADPKKFVDRFHRTWAQGLAETCALFAGTSERQVRKAVTITNSSLVRDHLIAGHKVLLVSAHTANIGWVWQGLCVEFADHNLTTIRTSQEEGLIEELILKAQVRHGGRGIQSHEVGKKLFSGDDAPNLLLAIGDFKPAGDANPKRDLMPFLGHRSYLHSSLPHLALHFGMHVVYLDMQRSGMGRSRITFSDLSAPPSARDLSRLQRDYVSQIEKSIRANPPAWWFWPKQLLHDAETHPTTGAEDGPVQNQEEKQDGISASG